MNTYKVTCKPNSNAFQSIADVAEFDLIEATEETETYEVRSECDIETALDASDGVISYETL